MKLFFVEKKKKEKVRTKMNMCQKTKMKIPPKYKY